MPTLNLVPSTRSASFDRVDYVPRESDRPTLSGYLRCLVNMADRRAEPAASERARNLMANQYRARFATWDGPDRPADVRAMAMASGAGGGYLVPDTVAPGVYRALAERSLIRRRATIVEMTGGKARVPILKPITPTVPGQSPFYGGFNPMFLGESVEAPDTSPEFVATELSAGQLVGSFAVPGRMLASLDNFDEFATELMTGAVGAVEEWHFVNGLGAGKPLGIRASSALVSTAARAGATAIADADIHAVWAKLLPSSKPNAVWVAGVGAEEKALASIGSDVRPAPPDEGAAYSYLGRPFVATERCPALNTLGDLMAIDPRYYLIGDGGLEVTSSGHFDFRNNVWWFRAVQHVAGAPWVNAPLVLTDGTTTVSPFVALAPSA